MYAIQIPGHPCPCSCGVAGERPTMEWSYVPRKIVYEKRLSFRGDGVCILLYYKWSHVSKVGVGEIPFHHQAMSDDIDDIQDSRHHMSRGILSKPVRGFAWACVALRARNASPWLLAILILARAHSCAVVFRRAPCVPRSREHEKRPEAGRKKNANVRFFNIY